MTTPSIDYVHVPRLLRPSTNLSGAQAVSGAMAVPAGGGVQFVDALGSVVTIPSSIDEAAFLPATQTFTGRNTFAPIAATGLATANAAVFVDASGATQTLAVSATGTYGSTRIKPGTVNGTAPGTTLNGLASLVIEGPPVVGSGFTAPPQSFALAVLSGDTLLDGDVIAASLQTDGSVTINGTSLILGGASTNITKDNDLTIDLTGGTPRTLAITNSGASVANLTVDGLGAFGGGLVTSAALAVTSTTLGFLPPRMTTTQRDAIATPAAGLIVYNTTTNKLNVRAAAAWEAITSV